MKQFEIQELEDISNMNIANLFNVFDEPELGVNFKTYSINRTVNFLDLDERSTKNSTVFSLYKVELQDTWMLISYKFYGTYELWWILAKVNNVIDPTLDIVVGTEIRILNDDIVNQVLQTIREN